MARGRAQWTPLKQQPCLSGGGAYGKALGGLPKGVLGAEEEPSGSKAGVLCLQTTLPGNAQSWNFQAATGVTFVSGQLSGEMRSGVPVAGAAEPVMATARPPVVGQRALPGL